MQPIIRHQQRITDMPLSLLMLGILLLYTYGIFVKAPYIGFYFNPTNGQVLEIYAGNDPILQVGDVLVKVGDVFVEEYQQDLRLLLFPPGIKKGDILSIEIERDNAPATIEWKVPGFTTSEFFGRFFNIWWLAYFFWFFGSIIELFIRPRDVRWRLLVAANHLTALWLLLGSFSAWHIWNSSILFHAVTWLILPVYLHLHWIFPKPLVNLPRSLGVLLYSFAGLIFLGELLQLAPGYLYAIALILALMGSFTLQVIHFIWRREQRRQVGLLAISTLLAILPSIALVAVSVFGEIPRAAPVALLALPFIPLAYIFLIFRNRLGGLEIRSHRIFSIYAYLIVIGTILLILLMSIIALQPPVETIMALVVIIPLVASAVSLSAYPAFQTSLDRYLLGIKLPYQNLQEAYSNRITTSTSIAGLLKLLDDEVFPSLLVRQFAFVQVSNETIKPLLTRNVTMAQLPAENGINDLVSRMGIFISDSSNDAWMRLILPLKVGDTFVGFWLLGSRDPDDFYSQTEIPTLQALANQTAIALSNLIHAEQLRKMYRVDIERNEQERTHLALELHDSILNQLAFLRNNLDENSISPKFQAAYEDLTRRLREIVSSLHPPMLLYGLKPALIELADNLMERNNDRLKIQVDLQAGEERLPEQMEQHLFRIAQEACENAFRHAGAGTITIQGILKSQEVDLVIADDGKGFDVNNHLEPDTLVKRRHFGIVGMIERAHLIGAGINIHSMPEMGTRIRLTWHPDP